MSQKVSDQHHTAYLHKSQSRTKHAGCFALPARRARLAPATHSAATPDLHPPPAATPVFGGGQTCNLTNLALCNIRHCTTNQWAGWGGEKNIRNNNLTEDLSPSNAAQAIQLKMYGWGSNKDGRLGNNSEATEKLPTEIKLNNLTFSSVACGSYHSGGITAEGKLSL